MILFIILKYYQSNVVIDLFHSDFILVDSEPDGHDKSEEEFNENTAYDE